jgi:hypothetical protein
MADEPSYFDGVRQVNKLLHSMESDFLAVLAEHERAEAAVIPPDRGCISDPQYTGMIYPKGLAQPDSPEAGLALSSGTRSVEPRGTGEQQRVSIIVRASQGVLNRLAFSLDHVVASDHPNPVFADSIDKVAYMVIRQLVEEGRTLGWYSQGFPPLDANR